jgi:DNA invertase Pin-like site-specific DNA recombinase
MERELILERTRAGLESARLQRRVGGRKRRMTDSKVQARKKAIGKRDAAARGGEVSIPTLYLWVPASSRA